MSLIQPVKNMKILYTFICSQALPFISYCQNNPGLNGTWILKDNARETRELRQNGDSIRIIHPDGLLVIFEGKLSKTGVYTGGRPWYFSKRMETGKTDCKKCWFYEKRELDDYAIFVEKTKEDVIEISADGNELYYTFFCPELTVERYPDWPGRCDCKLEWSWKKTTYVKAKK
jgi:hypothetical protein